MSGIMDEFHVNMNRLSKKVKLASEKVSKIRLLIDELKELGVEINSDNIDVNMDKLIDFHA